MLCGGAPKCSCRHIGRSRRYSRYFCNFNGDDAVALAKIEPRSYVDIFGVIGHRPSTAWTDGDHSTKDKTLVRKSTVAQGVTINPGGTEFTTLAPEWDLYDVDTFTYLGYHDCDASGYEVQAPTIQAHSLIAYPSHDEITLEWSVGNGAKRVIYVNTTNSFTPRRWRQPHAKHGLHFRPAVRLQSKHAHH